MSVVFKVEMPLVTSEFGPIVLTCVLCAVFTTWSGEALAEDELPSIKNSIGMELVLIPRGEFQMGTSAEEIAKFRDTHRKDPTKIARK